MEHVIVPFSLQDNAFAQRNKLACPLTNRSFEKGHTHTDYYIVAISGPCVAYYMRYKVYSLLKVLQWIFLLFIYPLTMVGGMIF